MVTNDDGIDGAGLQALVQVLVSTNRYQVFVCAPESYARQLISIFLLSALIKFRGVIMLLNWIIYYFDECRNLIYCAAFVLDLDA